MDAAKLQEALDDGSSQASFAVRVYRHGCLVGEDRGGGREPHAEVRELVDGQVRHALAFGRAMTLKLISPEDPVGSLLPEADKPTARSPCTTCSTMTSGLRWNGCATTTSSLSGTACTTR